jgi:hypothetical protein
LDARGVEIQALPFYIRREAGSKRGEFAELKQAKQRRQRRETCSVEGGVLPCASLCTSAYATATTKNDLLSKKRQQQRTRQHKHEREKHGKYQFLNSRTEPQVPIKSPARRMRKVVNEQEQSTVWKPQKKPLI